MLIYRFIKCFCNIYRLFIIIGSIRYENTITNALIVKILLKVYKFMFVKE